MNVKTERIKKSIQIQLWNQTWFKTFNSCNCRYIPWLWIVGKKKRHLLNTLQLQISDARTQLDNGFSCDENGVFKYD